VFDLGVGIVLATGDVVIVEGGWTANAGKSDITELPPWP
jgi:hypothetical protein